MNIIESSFLVSYAVIIVATFILGVKECNSSFKELQEKRNNNI